MIDRNFRLSLKGAVEYPFQTTCSFCQPIYIWVVELLVPRRRLRDPNASEIPDDFVGAWKEAVKTNSKAIQGNKIYAAYSVFFFRQAAKSKLFEKWLDAGKDWSLPLGCNFGQPTVPYGIALFQHNPFNTKPCDTCVLRLVVESSKTHAHSSTAQKKMGGLTHLHVRVKRGGGPAESHRKQIA